MASRAINCGSCRLTHKQRRSVENRDAIKAWRKVHYRQNREAEQKRSKDYYLANRQAAIEAAKKRREAWRRDDPDEYRAYERERVRRWREKNLEQSRKSRREYVADRTKTDPAYRLNAALSRAVRRGLEDGKRGRGWESLVGYSLSDLISHLERQFLPGMSWETYGRHGWHIDHILPLVSFDYQTPDDPAFRACWALTNLRPLWAADNLTKGAKVVALL